MKPSTRTDCGYPGMKRDECEKRGCCWDDTINGVHWCFHSGILYFFHLKPAGSRVLITVKNSALCAVFPAYVKLEISQFGSGDSFLNFKLCPKRLELETGFKS